MSELPVPYGDQGIIDEQLEEEAEREASAKWNLRITYFAVVALLIIVIGAGGFIPIGGAVITSGQLGVESRVKRINHPTGGIISRILVKDGDRVKKGQLLLRLDTAVTGASADLSGRTVDQILAQRARLLAEREGRGDITFPEELTNRKNEGALEAMRAEQRLMSLKSNERASLRGQLKDRINQLNYEIQGYRGQIVALQQQKELIGPEREGVRKLWEKKLVTINRLNELERTAISLDGSIASLHTSIAQTRARISETRQQLLQIDETARSEAAQELAQVNAALNERKLANISADDMLSRAEIRAPYDGVIDKLAFATVGSVVQPAEPIMEIVPDEEGLVVECAVNPADIDQVKTGQDARVRFTAFSSGTTPEFPGQVTFVSAERAQDEHSGASFYRARVAIDRDKVAHEGLALRPGMPAEVFISTESRSMLSYITKPLQDQFRRAFSD
ncbi:HlyD family type I secretion periplasmic adaptor subunit [Sphingobium sp. AS12]|uniref:HlyD family type I secretion periplasmic adaptor subunit n=1 Tax=Sphingobium sp. AS12 TaxID=2849495 RepID=UPI001C31B718|nr:HlyD family type I secretion periplasmic adaptor subunit [Sphingobium sp. AS12]MBV2149745.1 HlyD family type I secretion periplasmic adaptor subunit [Sphingobium sp. AS12]